VIFPLNPYAKVLNKMFAFSTFVSRSHPFDIGAVLPQAMQAADIILIYAIAIRKRNIITFFIISSLLNTVLLLF
jgi:hypothetical protein